MGVGKEANRHCRPLISVSPPLVSDPEDRAASFFFFPHMLHASSFLQVGVAGQPVRQDVAEVRALVLFQIGIHQLVLVDAR